MNSNKIFFDLDGTLIDSRKRSYILYKDILEKYGYKPIAEKRYYKLKRSKIPLTVLLKKSGADKLLKTFQKEWVNLIEDNSYLKYNTLMPYTYRILRKLSKDNELFLITLRKRKNALKRELVRFKLAPYFKVIPIDSATEKAKQLNLLAKPGDIIIGDSETDIRAGKKLGLITVAVSHGWRSKSLLKKERPNYLLKSLKELAHLVLSNRI